MHEELINLIKKNINIYDEKIKEINKKLLDYKPVYDVLKPKGKKFKKENIINLSFDAKLLDKLTNIVSKTNLIAVEKMIEYKIMFESHDKEVNEKLREHGLSKNIIFSDDFLNTIKIRSQNNLKLKTVYKKLIEMKKRDEKLFLINEKIVMYVVDVMIDLYESTLNEKEKLKEKKKLLEYTLKNINSNMPLIPRNLSVITSLINDNENNEERLVLLNELKEYLSKFEKEKTNETKEENKTPSNLNYVDNVILDDFKNIKQEDDEEDYIYNNYLTALRSLNNINDVKIFLDSIKYDYNLKSLLNNIINLLSTNQKDSKLKEIITNYLYEITINENHDIEKNDNKMHVFYYGFLEKQNKILQDIIRNNISNDYYNDILLGFKMIEDNGAKNKRKTITRIRKVYKLRINDIRITFKRLTNNLYVILGVFCKKDSKGNDIIIKTEKRNDDLIKIEKSLIDSFDIRELWDEYVLVNEDIKNELIIVLNSKRK